MEPKSNLRTFAIILASLLLPLTLLGGTLTAAILKANNPDNVDITTGLAYLSQTMTVAIVIFAVITAGIIGLVIAMYRRDHNFSEAKLPLTLLVCVLVVIALLASVNAYTNSVQDQYRLDHGQPTLDQFFDAIKQSKK